MAYTLIIIKSGLKNHAYLLHFSHIHSIQYPLALQVLNKCLELFLLHDPSSKRAQRATQSNNQSRNKELNNNENSKKQPCNGDLVGLNPISDVLSLIKTITFEIKFRFFSVILLLLKQNISF